MLVPFEISTKNNLKDLKMMYLEELVAKNFAYIYKERFMDAEVYVFDEKSIQTVFDASRYLVTVVRCIVLERNGENFNYKFLGSKECFTDFMKNGGVITILVYQGEAIAFNASMLINSEDISTLVFGISMGNTKNKLNGKTMKILGITYLSYFSRIAWQRTGRLYGTCMLNCPRTLHSLEPIFNKSCYPIRGIESKYSKQIRTNIFNYYIKPNFSNAVLYNGFPIVETSKVEMGFKDSIEGMKIVGDSFYDSYFVSNLSDFSKQDIVITGDLFDGVISFWKLFLKLQLLKFECFLAIKRRS